MKDKIKTEKPMGPHDLKPDDADEMKKEPLCDLDNSRKNGDCNNQDRNYLDQKGDMRPEDIKDEDSMLNAKIKTENLHDSGGLYPPVGVAGVQPLPSNVITRQPGTMEGQYMQQQSQIFVFSTWLANKAAENVLQGTFPSIIAYHCSQPGTKKYLEGVGSVGRGGGGGGGPGRDKACLGGRPTQPPPSGQPPSAMDPFINSSQYTLTGTKVPTENLTPQQRAHREEQLATIRKMSQILFPEHHPSAGDEFGNGNMMMPHNPQDGQPCSPCPPNGTSNGPPAPNRGPKPNADGPGGPGAPAPGLGPMCPEGADPNDSKVPKLPGGQPVAAQMEWQKLQHQFYDERKKKSSRTNSPIPRSGKLPPGAMQSNMSPMQGVEGVMPGMQQGPPPPYHQTARSASVPNAVSSPAPESPSNATTNMSLPSPRTCSDLNSPSDMVKMVKMTCSPPNNINSSNKMSLSNPDTPLTPHSASQSPTSNKMMFSSGQKSGKVPGCGTPVGPPGSKEPNLMPVPSPQQIQYLNAFDAQELTIQKQPNTSLKDKNSSPSNAQTLPDTPTCKTPTTTNSSPGQPHGSPRFQQMQQQQQQQQQPHTPVGPIKTECGGMGSSPNTNNPNEHSVPNPSPVRSSAVPGDNIPLNPNGQPCPPTSKSLQFDPITSLAQMSQQLTSQAPPPCQGPPYPPSGLMDQGMHMDTMDSMSFPPQGAPGMDLPPGYLNNPSPKPGIGTPPGLGGGRCPVPGPGAGPPFFAGPQFPRMMGPQSYNGMNVQVKASTPNTIQYLPARPSGINSMAAMPPGPGVRNPPSLEFLQRFANPPMPPGGGCHPDAAMMMSGQLLRGQIRPGGMKPGPPGPLVFDGGPMGPQGMLKGPSMGMGPDASQPLPPTMGQSNNFKNSPFVGPTIADPNYAQQFHNFQQQLYATNTRNQLNSHLNQSYFVPK